MVTRNMMRDGKYFFFTKKNNQICNCFGTDKIQELARYVAPNPELPSNISTTGNSVNKFFTLFSIFIFGKGGRTYCLY